MGIEIEHKFLVANADWRNASERPLHLVQGYLAHPVSGGAGATPCSVRVRIGAEHAWLTVKSALAGVRRLEYEYEIPKSDAAEMLSQFCRGTVEKIRHHVPHAGMTFEIDEFLGANAGLVIAEVELTALDAEYARPSWLGRDVSDLPRYYNQQLSQHPFSCWSAAERAGD